MIETNFSERVQKLSESYRSLSAKLNGLEPKRLRDKDDISKVLRNSLVKYKRVLAELQGIGYSDLKDLFPTVNLSERGNLVFIPDLATIADIDEQFITLADVACRDSQGNIFEQYDLLRVCKDVVWHHSRRPMPFTPYKATEYFEKVGLFLPSFALSCNILAALYANKKSTGSDLLVEKVLKQYSPSEGHGCAGFHVQNTLVNWETNQIIHYPSTKDYAGTQAQAGGTADINTHKKRTLLESHYDAEFSSNVPLLKYDLHEDDDFKELVQNLTGLAKPEILVEIGDYFKTMTRAEINLCCNAKATWLGCRNGYFSLNITNPLEEYAAARGVCLHPESAEWVPVDSLHDKNSRWDYKDEIYR